MFLFLSKLLPIFIYPLGLTCILLIVALIALWRRPQIAASCIGLSLVLLLLASNSWVSTWLVRSLEWQNLPPESYPNAEAIVVLGGAIRPQAPPRPWIDVAEAGDRPLHAARLYLQGKAPLIVLSGGRIDWKEGGPPESMDMAKLVQAMGVPTSALIEDSTSLNTYENAVNVKQILDQRGINRVLLVTSATHMPRSLRIFQKQGIEAIAAPTDFAVVEGRFSELNSSTQATVLNLLPDSENLQATSRVLKEYIGIVIYWLRGWL